MSLGETYIVERVIDGDTLKRTNGKVVQLIGIDAPEIILSEGDDSTLIDVTEEQSADLLQKLYQDARKNKRGLWSDN